MPPELEAGDVPGSYDYTGFRVPCCVVSAWAKKDYVSHQTFDHTSMLDFFDLNAKKSPFGVPPALTPPKNPFSSPAALPLGANTSGDVAMFHTTCTELPSGSPPPAGAKLSSPPSHANTLVAAQQKLIQKKIRAQL